MHAYSECLVDTNDHMTWEKTVRPDMLQDFPVVLTYV